MFNNNSDAVRFREKEPHRAKRSVGLEFAELAAHHGQTKRRVATREIDLRQSGLFDALGDQALGVGHDRGRCTEFDQPEQSVVARQRTLDAWRDG